MNQIIHPFSVLKFKQSTQLKKYVSVEVRPPGISPVHSNMPIVVILVLPMFRQSYCETLWIQLLKFLEITVSQKTP